MLRIGYVGNFGPSHSTENHVRQALGALGVDVAPLQEDVPATWDLLASANVEEYEWDFVLWTRTRWDPPIDVNVQRGALVALEQAGVPTVGFHLDRWFGLAREPEVRTEPFFAVDLLVTADGGHEHEFATAGVNHHWMPPAVSEFECEPGTPTARFSSPLAFVGSWQGYHPEWQHRAQLVEHLQRTWGRQIKFWPRPGEHAVRGRDLRDLYASTLINVGDSCLAGDATHYWSDRIPETLGRGGFLLHPYVEGLGDSFDLGEHLVVWQLGDWDQLDRLIAYYLANPDRARQIAAAGRAQVLTHHTYTVRMRQLLRVLAELDWIEPSEAER